MLKSGYTAIIDYQIGNLFSVQNALQYVGLEAVITSDKNVISRADAVVLPGVGAFGDAMKSLDRLDLAAPIKESIDSGKPFMGICLGLQLLFTESEEFGRNRGLDIIPGCVRKFPTGAMYKNHIVKVPQIAWNRINKASQNWDHTVLDGVKDGEYMYFVHSYYVVPDNDADLFTMTEYGGINFCSSIRRDNVFASQFHPEKSSMAGIAILKNFKTTVDQQFK